MENSDGSVTKSGLFVYFCTVVVRRRGGDAASGRRALGPAVATARHARQTCFDRGRSALCVPARKLAVTCARRDPKSVGVSEHGCSDVPYQLRAEDLPGERAAQPARARMRAGRAVW